MGEPHDVISADPQVGRTRLGDDVRVILRLGGHLAAAGTGSYRVRQAMRTVAAARSIDALDATVTMTSIAVTARRGEEFRTIVREVAGPHVDAGRIARLEGLAATVRSDEAASSIDARLSRVLEVPGRWGPATRAFAAGVGCAAFALSSGLGIADALAVCLAAGLGQRARTELVGRHLADLAAVAAAALVSCLTHVLLASLVGLLHQPAPVHQAGQVAALLYLVPGFPLYTALLDLAHLDVMAAQGRLVHVTSVLGVSGGVAWSVSSLTGASAMLPAPSGGSPLSLPVAAVVGVVAVGAFAVLFNSHLRMVVLAALVGGGANLVRICLARLGQPPQNACLAAGLVLGLLAAGCAAWAQLPRITVSVPAAVVMLPGTTMHQALHHLNAGSMPDFLAETCSAMLLVAAVSSGLALARILTDPGWAYDPRRGALGELPGRTTP
ncbi:threonine/serine ThrE exporter family protein [Arsenicicoccus dermatophilus]|uniref:threonine/serine ThrE exporter family protein n=1 Tax=Arsenicicoccus dermatophilus TaxID=1076331 RepID=UPI001F4C57B0|nr:threonine/serine exporter family protein [Arsenicicoccus dermatophilus]MCH8613539.1 threonine/serine exporter family protein [Arsenicicoccus dermatophilus]